MTLQHKIVDALLVIVSLAIGFGVGTWYLRSTAHEPPTTSKPVVLTLVQNDKQQVVVVRDGERDLVTVENVKDVAARATAKDFSGYPAHYDGECIGAASASPNGKRVVFSIGCPPGDLAIPWTGVFDVASGGVDFLVREAGSMFAWASDGTAVGFAVSQGLIGGTRPGVAIFGAETIASTARYAETPSETVGEVKTLTWDGEMLKVCTTMEITEPSGLVLQSNELFTADRRGVWASAADDSYCEK